MNNLVLIISFYSPSLSISLSLHLSLSPSLSFSFSLFLSIYLSFLSPTKVNNLILIISFCSPPGSLSLPPSLFHSFTPSLSLFLFLPLSFSLIFIYFFSCQRLVGEEAEVDRKREQKIPLRPLRVLQQRQPHPHRVQGQGHLQ